MLTSLLIREINKIGNIMTNQEKYDKIFCDTFQVAPDQLSTLAFKETPLWDSVGHLTLISALEDAFDILLETEDMMEFSSYQKGIEILQKYEVYFNK